MRSCAVPLALAVCLAQSVEQPRRSASDYPAHAELKTRSLGADFLVHTFSGNGKSFFTADYLVVEAAFYPARGQRPVVAHSHFLLRVNGKERIHAQLPQFVAASLKHPDWEGREGGVVVGAGAGDLGVILGRRERTPRFPGDTGAPGTRLPAPPRAPKPEDRSGIESEPVLPEQVCVEQALPEGPAAGPIRGYLYFPYKGKVARIAKLELLYAADGERATLKLR
jgi:hypothetical protein